MKLIANKESYGFKGKLWSKGEVVDVSQGEIYPKEHFDIIGEPKEGDVKPQVKPETKKKH